MSEIVNLTLVFEELEPAKIQRIAERTSDPDDPEYGKHLRRDELRELVALTAEERRAVVEWLASYDMKIVESRDTSPQLMFVQATETQLNKAFGEGLRSWLEKAEDLRGAPRMRLNVPRRLAGYIQKVGGLPGETGQFARTYLPASPGDGTAARRPVVAATAGAAQSPVSARPRLEPPPEMVATTPADILEIYNFPPQWNGQGETIALLQLGGRISEDDLHTFWRGHGIPAPEFHTVQVGPSRQRTPHPFEIVEATMSVEWAAAMAPGARVVAYFVDPTIMGDPWAAFLFAVIGDEKFAPSIASISWVAPERKYYRLHGHKVIGGLLDQAAALGITVIAASGDWGPFDGVPRTIRDGRYVSDAAWPHGVFPAVEERVLGVGGTMITSRKPLTEIAWSGPLPVVGGPAVPFELVASSGGFSEDVPIPAWQKSSLRGSYPRGASTPAVVPYGRGFPDVALMASGPAVQRGLGEPLTSQAYQAVVDGQWVDYAGGTSLAAPIWAAIIARANQARRQAGLSRLGFVNPLLYRISEAEPKPFREITAGAADVSMYSVNSHGRATTYRLPGYECGPGWNPVTGLGVPDVAALISQVCGKNSRTG